MKICDFGVSGEVDNSVATTFIGYAVLYGTRENHGQTYSVSCDVWSLGLTLLEVARGLFPYHLQMDSNPLGPIELLSLILEYQPRLEDIPEDGIFWSDSLKNFISYCLKKNAEERPSPQQMLQHPWCVGPTEYSGQYAKFVFPALGRRFGLITESSVNRLFTIMICLVDGALKFVIFLYFFFGLLQGYFHLT